MKCCSDCGEDIQARDIRARLCTACAKRRRLDRARARRKHRTGPRTCRYCSTPLPPENRLKCNSCQAAHAKAQRKARYWAAPEAARSATKAWAQANPAKARAAEVAKLPRRRARRAADPTLRAGLVAKCAEWYRGKASDPIFRAANSRRACRWSKDNPQKKAVQSARRRARERSAPGSFTAAEWQERLDLFGGLCAYCDRPATQIDHVIPLARGGTNYIDNLAPACQPCNASKGDRMPLEWAGVRT